MKKIIAFISMLLLVYIPQIALANEAKAEDIVVNQIRIWDAGRDPEADDGTGGMYALIGIFTEEAMPLNWYNLVLNHFVIDGESGAQTNAWHGGEDAGYHGVEHGPGHLYLFHVGEMVLNNITELEILEGFGVSSNTGVYLAPKSSGANFVRMEKYRNVKINEIRLWASTDEYHDIIGVFTEEEMPDKNWFSAISLTFKIDGLAGYETGNWDGGFSAGYHGIEHGPGHLYLFHVGKIILEDPVTLEISEGFGISENKGTYIAEKTGQYIFEAVAIEPTEVENPTESVKLTDAEVHSETRQAYETFEPTADESTHEESNSAVVVVISVILIALFAVTFIIIKKRK